MLRSSWRLAVVVTAVAGCGRDALDREALVDPAACEGCHADHVREWSGSMHAYASDDPVFQAMNRLGQRATSGALGDFCVRCHAPVAVAAGLTTNGLDLDDVPRSMRGVTCIACHQVATVTALHNGGLTWSDDDVMLGGLDEPQATGGHRSAYSPLLDSSVMGSSDLCGACHDVRAGGLAIEAPYAEWAASVFADPVSGVSCGGCHLAGRDDVAARGGPTRRVHDHRMAAVDVALTPWPEILSQRDAIDRDLAGVVSARLCVYPTGGGVRVEVMLDNILAGHAFPSGVTHARRAWVTLTAEEGGVITFERGRFGPGEVIAATTADTWVMTSRFLDDGGDEVTQVWDARAIESSLLMPAVTRDPDDPRYYHAQTRSWFVAGQPERVAMSVQLEAVGLDVIDALIVDAELDPALRQRIPRHLLRGTRHEWRRDRDDSCAP